MAGSLRRHIPLPSHAIYTHWTLPGPTDQLVFDICFHNDPGSDVGLYYAPWNGYIDGQMFYFGVQTDVQHPDGHSTGKGWIFSTWWTFDLGDTAVPPDGFVQQGTHEGRFVGVRRNVVWTEGEWVVRLERGASEGDGDWFDLSVESAVGERSWIGSIRFKRADPGVPATISPTGPAFLEAYSGVSRYRDLPDWHVDAMVRGCSTARSDYPAFPTAEVPNCDSYYDAERHRVHALFGQRVHDPMTLF